MTCNESQKLLGPFLDDELDPGRGAAVQSHLAQCSYCQAELSSLEDLARQLGRVAEDTPCCPSEVWTEIERRLDASEEPAHGPLRIFRRPLALAASLALFIGMGVLFSAAFDRSIPTASAAVIDYRILMDGVASNVRGSIERFLTHYQARTIDRADADRLAPDLSFDLPAVLPSGYQFEQAYSFKLGTSNVIAATYEGDGTPLFLIFHPTSDNVKGPKETSCRIGDLHAGQIEAGRWRLVHVMDESTCHCVLSTLQDESLQSVVQAVSPGLTAGSAVGAHCH